MYSLKAEIAELVRARIASALVTCDGNKTAASELLGLGSYQNLTNWMMKYGVSGITSASRELARERLKKHRVESFEASLANE